MHERALFYIGGRWVKPDGAGFIDVRSPATEDVIEFKQAVFADLQAVLAAATQVGADVLITADANNTLTLKSVVLSSLHADDFRFVA